MLGLFHQNFPLYLDNGMLLTWFGRGFYKFLLLPYIVTQSLSSTPALHYHPHLQARACEDGNKGR